MTTTTPPTPSLVRTEVRAGVTIIALARPERRNALTPRMFADLRAALPPRDLQGGVVLTGDGPVFCGGFDLKLCVSEPATTAQLLNDLAALLVDLASRDHPVVISAHGAAIAGGAALLGAADYSVGDAAGQYGYPVVRLGISPAVSFPFLRTLTTDGAARERLVDTGLLDGRAAQRVGMLSAVADTPEACLPAAIAACETLAAKPRRAFAATKNLLRSFGPSAADAQRALAASLLTADTDEARTLLAAAFGPKP